MINKIIRIYKEKGFVKATKYIIKKINGQSDIEDQIYTLQWFLNECFDIQQFPKAKGNLRKLQNCDTQLLKVFDSVCKKHEIKYWLDFGTLLGAVRHGGFIPWDDDMDVAMTRDDYNRALSIFPNELSKYGIDVYEFSFRPMVSFGFSYKHKKTGIWLDVFPVDICNYSNMEDDKLHNVIMKSVKKYRRFYSNHKRNTSIEKMRKVKSSIFPLDRLGNIYLHGPEFVDHKVFIHEKIDIFPLKQIKFENYMFSCPNNLDKYLKELYGDTYMDFPHNGVLKHGSDCGNLADWAEQNGVYMDDVFNRLIEIDRMINNEDCSN